MQDRCYNERSYLTHPLSQKLAVDVNGVLYYISLSGSWIRGFLLHFFF